MGLPATSAVVGFSSLSVGLVSPHVKPIVGGHHRAGVTPAAPESGTVARDTVARVGRLRQSTDSGRSAATPSHRGRAASPGSCSCRAPVGPHQLVVGRIWLFSGRPGLEEPGRAATARRLRCRWVSRSSSSGTSAGRHTNAARVPAGRPELRGIRGSDGWVRPSRRPRVDARRHRTASGGALKKTNPCADGPNTDCCPARVRGDTRGGRHWWDGCFGRAPPGGDGHPVPIRLAGAGLVVQSTFRRSDFANHRSRSAFFYFLSVACAAVALCGLAAMTALPRCGRRWRRSVDAAAGTRFCSAEPSIGTVWAQERRLPGHPGQGRRANHAFVADPLAATNGQCRGVGLVASSTPASPAPGKRHRSGPRIAGWGVFGWLNALVRHSSVAGAGAPGGQLMLPRRRGGRWRPCSPAASLLLGYGLPSSDAAFAVPYRRGRKKPDNNLTKWGASCGQ